MPATRILTSTAMQEYFEHKEQEEAQKQTDKAEKKQQRDVKKRKKEEGMQQRQRRRMSKPSLQQSLEEAKEKGLSALARKTSPMSWVRRAMNTASIAIQMSPIALLSLHPALHALPNGLVRVSALSLIHI